jgi:hypothetical protein
LSVLLEYILSGGPSTRILEDRMAYLCRGLDGLCKHYGVDTQNYRQGLDNSYLSNVNMVLSSAAQEILNLANSAASNSDLNQSNILKRIADRTKQSPIGKDKAFGLAVVDLLKLPQFNLHDADVVSCYYRCANIRDWPGTLSYYRGVVLHEGAFYSSKGTHNLKDVVVVMDHLHDIMIRIAFKIFGYKGAYQPTVIKGTALESVDWVDPTCLPSRLGYR